jgi:DNA polymerase III delta prime subunit
MAPPAANAVPDRSPPAIFDLPASPVGHFKLYLFATIFRVIEQAAASSDSAEALLERFPFLAGYLDELPVPAERGPTFWPDAVDAFEAGVPGHLPLRALRDAAGLDHEAIALVLAAGLIEEDARFGAVFEAMQDAVGVSRPTLGLLTAWWRDAAGVDAVRARLRRLRDLGLIQPINPDAPRMSWALHVPGLLWDAIRGDAPESPAPSLRHRAAATLPALGGLILPDELRAAAVRLPALLASGEVRAVIVRGPRRNGRRTLIAAIARALGRGVLELGGALKPDDERWRWLGPLATLLHAVPVLALDPGPGETIDLPALAGHAGPVGIVLSRHGGVTGPGAEGGLTLTVAMPDPDARRRHWQAGLDGAAAADLDAIAERFRLTGGHIRRAAALARAHRALRGADQVGLADVRDAGRALRSQALDTLATRLEATGTIDHLATRPDTLRELRELRARCQHRERLPARLGAPLRDQVNLGVRALFQGPSGTGKTLAAKLLAAELGMDLYRVELASVVSKFIGETEKNLGQIFGHAEELDIVLLLDEGDALLTQRTQVQTSNDRYANLETNYLLQRIESFDGILVITTNAGDLIDGAFRRRMDAVVEFAAPEPAERLRLWQLHLPAEHAVDPGFVSELAARCAFTGGQIRNAVLHASLLAMAERTIVHTSHIEAAAQRECRRIGTVYPMRRRASEAARS